MQVAQAQLDEARKLSAEAERKLAEAKVMEVERMSQHVTSMENNEEEEVPDAYLREDWNNYPEAAKQNKQMRYSAFSLCSEVPNFCCRTLCSDSIPYCFVFGHQHKGLCFLLDAVVLYQLYAIVG